MALAGAEVRPRSAGQEPEISIAGTSLDREKTYRVAAEDFHATETPGLKGAPAQSGDDVRDLVERWVRRQRGRTASRPQ